MAHPYSHKAHNGYQVARKRYADGGGTPPSDYSDLPPDIAQQMRDESAKVTSGQNQARSLGAREADSVVKGIGRTGRERIAPDGKVSGFKRGGKAK